MKSPVLFTRLICFFCIVSFVAINKVECFNHVQKTSFRPNSFLHLKLLSENAKFRIHSSSSIPQFGTRTTDLTPLRMKTALSAVANTQEEVKNIQSPDPEAKPSFAKSTPTKTLKKLLPLGAMLFFILFNYTILRDTKDVLVVTAPNSGAEIIPFLKTYVNLPSALGFTVLYSYLCNQMSSEKVFYVLISSFLAFFGAFAGFICK